MRESTWSFSGAAFVLIVVACSRGSGGDKTLGVVDTSAADSGGGDGAAVDTCPYQDAGGFYSGGEFNVAMLGAVNVAPYPYDSMPTKGPGTRACIALNSDGYQFTWTWLDGSWAVWNDSRIDWTPTTKFDCTVDSLGFSCDENSQVYHIDEFPTADISMYETIGGQWRQGTEMTGEFRLYVKCDRDCEEFWNSLDEGFTSTPNVYAYTSFTATLDE